jgi:hypothetical protein
MRWASYEEPTLDQAFSIKPRKHAEEAEKRERLMPLINARVAELHEAGEPIDAALMGKVGRELGVSGAHVYNIYYAEANMPRRLLLGLPVRRKTGTKRPQRAPRGKR